MADADAKAAVLAVSNLPGDLPRLTWAYLGLFRRPGSSRVLTWERVGRVVSELTALVSEPETQWKGQRVVPNRPEYWAEAMRMVIDRDACGKLERPLDGHNYLRAIAYEIAEKAWHAGNVRRESEAQYRPAQTRPQRNKSDEYQPVPLAEGLKGWRQRLGVPQEGK